MPTQWSREKYFKALKFAAEAHEDQLMPGTELPYVVHVSLVAMEIISALVEEEVDKPNLAVQCALLHDCLEDTSIIYDEIVSRFGSSVGDGVLALSKDGAIGISEDEYKRDLLQLEDSLQRIKQQPREIWMVKLADRITNLQPPPKHWSSRKIEKYHDEANQILVALGSASSVLSARLSIKIERYKTYF